MIMTDQTKIRISREILSDGLGYTVYPAGRHIRNGVDITKRHMGKYVEGVYIPTSPEWEPPTYLVGKQWHIVNEKGNRVGLKAYIPLPDRRHFYSKEHQRLIGEYRERHRQDSRPPFEVFLKGHPNIVLFRWPPWKRRPRGHALLMRVDTRRWWKRLLRKRSPCSDEGMNQNGAK